MKKIFTGIILPLVISCQPLWAQVGPVKGKGQSQSTFQTIERLETPNSGVTVTGDKAVLLESDPDNLLVNPGFEHQTFSTGWTVNNGTPTVDTTNFYDGKKSMSIALTAVNGDILTQCVTPTGQKGGTNLSQSLRVKTTLANLQVCSVIGSSEQQCIGASNSDSWIEIAPSSVAPDATALCVKLKSTSSATGTVKVDSGYIGKNKNIGTSSSSKNVVNAVWSGTQSITHTAETTLTLSGAVFDKLENFTHSSGVFTATVAGDYRVSCGWERAAVSDASIIRHIQTVLRKNSTEIYKSGIVGGIAGNAIEARDMGSTVTQTLKMSIGDTFDCRAYQSNASGFAYNAVKAVVSADFFPPSLQQSVSAATVRLPTITTLAGSGTYTVPAGATSIRVKMTGGGGGANGNSGTACTSGSNGASTTFGNATAIQGLTGALQGACQGQSLSSNTNTITGAISIVSSDSVCGQGGSSANASAQASGGQGGSNFIAIGGAGSAREILGTVGRFGGGGGGTGSFANATFMGCGGGNSGGYLEFIVNSPNLLSSYAYAVGAGGAGGIGSRQNGAAGGNGTIIIEEYYGYNAPIIIGSITSGSTGAIRSEFARINNNGTATISFQGNSNWLTSCSRSAAGVVTCTIASGVFAASPACAVTLLGLSGNIWVNPVSTTSATVLVRNQANTDTDNDFYIMCSGLR